MIPVSHHGDGAGKRGKHDDHTGEDRGAAPRAELPSSVGCEGFGKLSTHGAPSMSSTNPFPRDPCPNLAVSPRGYREDVTLDRFSAPVRAWFETSFAAPTDAQVKGWPAIANGDHTLLLAPTGSGKTLAAFLWAIDKLGTSPPPAKDRRCRVLYVSPLRALAFDVEKNLRAPVAGITLAGERLGEPFDAPTVAMRTGDTPSKERQQLVRNPADILITTPESLYLMLTSRARETLRGVQTVIIDEIHALAPTKRGADLMLSLERLEAITDTPPQRIGLSATQRPLDEIARFLGGFGANGQQRPVTVVDAGSQKSLDVEVIVPVDDMNEPGAHSAASGATAGALGLDDPESHSSIWPHVHPRILDLIREHRTTIVFCNARRLAERLAASLNELAGEELVRAHHGSLAREQRVQVESELKEGRLRGIVATSSLELGIDMGTVDLVVLVESPGSVARGIQRVGRAGHQVGEPSVGKIFPKYRGDLLEAAIVVQRMREGLVEEMRYPRNPLDVLAEQIVAACAIDEWSVDDLYALVRRCANFAELSEDAYRETLDMLAGRYPSDRFAGLRPRVVWDRIEGRVRGREGAQRVAVQSGGTIPDRGLFGVFLPDGGRVGELDEEMVYESRVGECFVLGASTWRIEEITVDRVVVTPAPGEPAKTPFWKGDRPGRPLELGRALGGLVRELRSLDGPGAEAALRAGGLDARAASNLRMYLDEQAESTGAIPDDRTIVIERFPDEIGDWRVCILTPFGSRVHAPWALVIEERLARGSAGAGVVERRRHHLAAARVDRRCCHRAPAPRARRDRRAPRGRAPEHVTVRVEVPRERGAAHCYSPAGARASAHRCGSNASVRPTCSRSPADSRRSRCCWRRHASACATCSTSPHCARC